MKDIYIIGSGGFAREVAVLIDAINSAGKIYNLKGFVVDLEYFTPNSVVAGLPVLCMDQLDLTANYVIAIADSGAREKIYKTLKEQSNNLKFPVLIHPHASIGARIAISEGTIICEGCILTCDIQVGSFVIINLNTTVGHDACLKDYCTVNPTCTISGNVLMGEHAFIGTGANILEKLSIGHCSKVGGGSLVKNNVPDGATVVGVPAKEIRKNSN